MSGASEATLQELLSVNQQMAASIAKLAGGGGGGGSGGGGGGPAGKAAGALGKTFETLGKGAGAVTGIFSAAMRPALKAVAVGMDALAKTGSVLLNNQLALAEGAITGANKLSDLTKGLEQLPLGIGQVMKLYTYQVKKMEATIATYDQISSTGARFGGSLDQVRNAAKSTYLSLDEFSKLMKDAGPQLRFMGTTSEEGAKNLVKFNSTMIKGEVGKGLLGMGYSLQEANQMIANYSEAVGGLKADQLKDQKAMEKSVKFFAEELDAAAQLEGKTREQKLAEMKKDSQNAAVKAKLADMSDEQRLKYEQAMLKARSQGEKEYIQSRLLGIAPQTKAGQQFAAMNAEAAEAAEDQVKAIESSKTALEERDRINGNSNKILLSNAKMYKDMGVVGSALIMGNSALKDQASSMAESYAEIKNTGLDTQEKLDARSKKLYEEQEKAQKGNIGAQKQAQGAAKYAGEALMDSLYKTFEPLIKLVLRLNEAFLQYLPTITKFLDAAFGQAFKIIKDIFSGVDWGVVKESFMGAWNMLTESFGSIFDAVKGAFGGGGKGIGEFLQKGMTMFFDTFKGVVEVVGIIVAKFVSSNLFQSLKQFMLNMWDLVKALVDAVVAIVKSPVGEFVIDTIFAIFETLFDIANALIDATIGVVKFIGDVFKFISQDFAQAWQKIKEWAGKILDSVINWFKEIPKKITDFFGEGSIMEKIFDALKGIIGSIWEGIKSVGSKITSWFTSESKPAAPEPTPSASAPTAPNQPLTAEAQKRAEEEKKKTTPVTANPANSTVPVVQPKSNDPMEILRAEIQTLNNITAEMLRAMRDTRDYTRSAATALASNGNLFKRA